MGSTAKILVNEKSYIHILNIIENIQEISKSNNFYFKYVYETFAEEENYQYMYIYGCIGNEPIDEDYSELIPFYINDEKYDKNSYNVYNVDKDKKIFFSPITIEDFTTDNASILLKFSYELLKIYQQAKLYTGSKWLYTLKDLEKIVNTPYDEYWFSKNPGTI